MDSKTESERQEEEIARPAHDLWDTAPITKKTENQSAENENEFTERPDEKEPSVMTDETSPIESSHQSPTVHESFYSPEPAPSNTPPQQPSDTMDEESSFSIGGMLRGVLIIAIFVFILLLFFYIKGNKSSETVNQETTTATLSVSPTPRSIEPTKPITNPSITTKRLFNPTANFFNGTTYPVALTSYKDKDLVGISCSSTFNCSDTGCTATRKNAYTPSSSAISTWYKEAVITTSTSNISDMQACQTATDQTILLYHQPGDSQGIGSVDYVGRVEPDNTVTRLVAITNLSYPHFLCDKPLELTSLDLLFLQCSSKSDQFTSETIYGVNMTTSAYTQLINCTSQRDEATNKTISSCQ